MTTATSISAKAAELRRVFDQARAVPSSTGVEVQTESLLAIRVARDPYAIRVSEISGISTDKKVVAFPSPIPELLGVAGLRGAIEAGTLDDFTAGFAAAQAKGDIPPL